MARLKEKLITLLEPIAFGSETITELKITRPKGKHLRSMPMDPNVGDFLDLAGKLTGYPPSVMDELDAEDVTQVAEAVEAFLDGGQKTGSSGSQS